MMVEQSRDSEHMVIARRLAADIATRADAADKAGALPKEDIAALQASGYLAFAVPKEYGGYGLSLGECVAAQVALAQGSAATALVMGMQLHVFGHAREGNRWAPSVFAEFCRAVVEDGALFNSIATEPALGSPSRGAFFKTTAVPEGNSGQWVLNGRKTWATGGTHLTHMLVRCMVEEEPGVVLVRQGAAGITWRETWGDSLSMRASDSHDVAFENVRLSADQILERGRGKGAPKNVWFPMMMSSIYMGTAIAARNTVIQYALERVPTALGKPIATLPKIQRQIGEMDIAIQAAEVLLYKVADQWTGRDADRAAFVAEIAAAKHMVTETANQVTDKALRIAGGISITKSLPLERYFRDVRAGSMQPPSGDTALEIVGRAAISKWGTPP